MTPEHDLALSTHAYYVGELDAGRRACERLLARGDLDAAMADAIRANRVWYLQTLADYVPTTFVRLDVEPAHEGWSLFNPTVIVHDSRILAIVRSSNYTISPDGRYEMPDADQGVIRTENLLVTLGQDLTVAGSRRIAGPPYAATGFPVTGLEDCRLRYTASGIGVSATVRDVAPHDGNCRIAVAELALDEPGFFNFRVLSGATPLPHEKNWMPILGKRAWLYMASLDGHTVTVGEDPEIPDAYSILRHGRAPPIAAEFRGGSQLVPFDGGYLGIVHEVSRTSHRAYEHRFVWFDTAYTLNRVSDAFAIREPKTIEFAAGLAMLNDTLVISFGVRDAEAWVVEVPADGVRDMLREARP